MSYPYRLGILAREGRQIFVVPAKAGTQSLPPVHARGRLWHEQGAAHRSMSEKRPCVYILASKRNGTFMSVLRAVLGNIVRTLSAVLFGITECIA